MSQIYDNPICKITISWPLQNIILTLFLVITNLINASPFVEYASSPNLSEDERHTISLILERASHKFDERFWNELGKREDPGKLADGGPRFSLDQLQLTSGILSSFSGLYLGRPDSDDRPVRDLTALQYFPNLSTLYLDENEIINIAPLSKCIKLKELRLSKNPVRNLSPLAGCMNLKILAIEDTPVGDLSPLESLPQIRNLSLSSTHVPALKRLKRLPHLRTLSILGKDPISTVGFPEMPELREFMDVDLVSLEGLQRFSKLEYLGMISGDFDSLEPLRNLNKLTHIDIERSQVNSLSPLSSLTALCDLSLHTSISDLSLDPISGLKRLHEINLEFANKEPPGLIEIRSKLSSWDNEFLASSPKFPTRHKLHVVDQNTFDSYMGSGFGLNPSGESRPMLSAEFFWIERQIETQLKQKFRVDEDYDLAAPSNRDRTKTVVLLTDHAIESLNQILPNIQTVLARAKNDWIVYLACEGVEYIAYAIVFSDKIITTKSSEETFRTILQRK